MDAVTTILGVSVRNTRTGQVYDVACGDGQKRQVWEAGLATAINSYAGTGQPIQIRFTQKQNGKYLNESIQEFAPPGQQLPPDTNAQPAPMGGGQPIAGAMLPQQQAVQPLGGGTQAIQPAPSGGGGQWSPEVTTRVTKLASIEYATTLVGALLTGAGPEAMTDALALVDAAAKHFYAVARSHEQQPQQAAPVAAQPVATTPAEVVAQMPPGTVQVGAPVEPAPATDVIQWD